MLRPTALDQELKRYVRKKAMKPTEVKKVSVAAASICEWVHAMHNYSKVALKVAPKKKRLEKLNKKLIVVRKTLASKQAMLAKLKKEVAKLQRKLAQEMDIRLLESGLRDWSYEPQPEQPAQ